MAENFEVKDNTLQAIDSTALANSLHTTTEALQKALKEYTVWYGSPEDKNRLARYLNNSVDINELSSILNIQALTPRIVAKSTTTETPKSRKDWIYGWVNECFPALGKYWRGEQ